MLVNAARVEKSYFDSKVLDARASSRSCSSQGLEQARDTRAPEVLVRERFRPFVEDELDALSARARRAAPPPAPRSSPCAPAGAAAGARGWSLAIGPEGGWVPFEAELLEAHGFRPFSLGPRTLRVETAVPVLLGQWHCCERTLARVAHRA